MSKYISTIHNETILILKDGIAMKIDEISKQLNDYDKELETTDKLLESFKKVIEAIPECKVHGSLCIPNALDWINKKKSESISIQKN